jgi:hypothetical protein
MLDGSYDLHILYVKEVPALRVESGIFGQQT